MEETGFFGEEHDWYIYVYVMDGSSSCDFLYDRWGGCVCLAVIKKNFNESWGTFQFQISLSLLIVIIKIPLSLYFTMIFS